MSDEIETHPRDFLRRFGGGERPTVKEEPVKEVELSLGLYLGRGGGGGFSGDNKGLIRSSSLYTFPKKEEEEEVYRESPAMASAHTLIRACSLPVETGDAQRKREELQSLRRLEAKRKREERRSLRLRAEENGAGGATDATSSSSSTHRRKRVPDYDFQPMQGLDITRCNAKKPSLSPPAKQSSPPVWSPAEIDMPCVSAKGDGPNGKRIDGFLYKYSKGEEVRIMCVCHGSFLNPTEFVKHAGGGDVEYPLRHIVVHPSSSQTFL